MLLAQQDSSLKIRESQPRVRGHVSFSPETKEREERSQDTPADLPFGWGRTGSSNTLAGWLGVYTAP